MFETTNQIKVIHDEIFTVFQSARSLRVGCIFGHQWFSACCAVGQMGQNTEIRSSSQSPAEVWIPMVGAAKPINSLPRCFYKWGCGLQTYPWLYSSCCCWQLLSLNVNPGLINPGWLIVVVPQIVINGYWNGTPQLNSRLGFINPGLPLSVTIFLDERTLTVSKEIIAITIRIDGH